MVSAVIVAGGKGKRMGADQNKVFLKLLGREIILRTVDAFVACPEIDEIVVVTAKDDMEKMRTVMASAKHKVIICEGGKERSDSVMAGLVHASGDVVLVHDGARACVRGDIISAVVRDTKEYGAAATGVFVKDTLKAVNESGDIVATVDRARTVQIQTPQGFMREELIDLSKRAKADGLEPTDDARVFEEYGKRVHLTVGSYDNIKITTPEDLAVGEMILKRRGV